ncbi:biotin carboxyl carrier protein [Nitrobacteraceae bacterium AZCC 2146]
MHHTFVIGGEPHAIWLSRSPEGYRLALAEGGSAAVSLAQTRGGEERLTVDGSSEPIAYVVEGDTVHIHLRGRSYAVRYVDPLVALAVEADTAGHHIARAPMPGVVVSVKAVVGERVVAGTVVAVIESMKLETAIRAAQDGIVEKIHVTAGESFDRDAALVTLSREAS